MKKKSLFGRAMALFLVLLLLANAVPILALSGGAAVATTPYQQFCGANIRLGGTDYLCAVDLGQPVIDSASDTVMTPGTTVRMDLFFNINGGWYACRVPEMQGDPNDLFTVRMTETQGGDRVSEPVWKTYPDEYGDRYYLEFVVLGGETDAPVDVSVALTQPDAANVGAEYRITGTSAAWDTCTADFTLPGYTGPCDIYFGDPVTSTGDPAAMVPGATVCFPLMFLGGDGQLYAAYNTEMQGDPNALFTVEQSGDSLLTLSGWKTWENGHWFLECTVGQGGSPGDPITQTVRLRQSDAYRATPWKPFSGAMGQKGPCQAQISIGGTVYPCTVDLQGYLTSTGDEQSMTANSTICLPLMFLGGDDQWHPVLESELQGDPAQLFTVSEIISSGNTLLTQTGWKTWENGHYYLEYTVADSQYETPLELSVQLRQDDAYSQGSVETFSGTAPASSNPGWRQCVASISIGGTVYECVVDFQGYLTSSGSDTLTGGGTVCIPLMFQGGDGAWYPVLKDELQGTPGELFTVQETITAGDALLHQTGWKTWENGHYYLEYAVADAEFETQVEFSATLTQPNTGKYGDPVPFSGTVPASDNPFFKTCRAPIKIDGTVYECKVELQGYLTSSGSDTLTGGGTVCIPLMFQGGDGAWHPVLKDELQGTPGELFTVEETITAGDALLHQTGWKTWENGHYYLEYAVADAEFETQVEFSATLAQPNTGKYGDPVPFSGTVPASDNPFFKTCRVPIKIDGTVYECVVDFQGYLTSSGSDTLADGDFICFPLMFRDGDGAWYPVLKDELQGDPAQLFTVVPEFTAGGDNVRFIGWSAWDSGHYYAAFQVTAAATETDVRFTAQLKKDDAHTGTKDPFDGVITAKPLVCSAPIKIDGTVYDCIVDFQGYLTSSGSDTLTGGGTVCLPLMFQGGDGKWYPVLKGELQGTPDELFTVQETITSGGNLLKATGWKTWENGHYYLEYTVADAKEDTNVTFSVQLCRNGAAGTPDAFNGKVPGASMTVPEEKKNCSAPIKIDGTVYDCIVDFRGSLTSSGSETIPSGGTVAFPLLFMGADGEWYPVLKEELQGDPADLFTYTMNAQSGGELLTCTGWKTWENGHYYLEYKVGAPKEMTKLEFGVVLGRGGVDGTEDRFSGYVQAGPDISGMQIPMKPSASLVVERMEECQDFNTMSFTIDGVRYDEGWPIDFESPNTTSAVITDGTVIRSDLCFMVNGQWHPVRQQECNASVEELFTYDYQVISGDNLLSTPRFTTRYDAYGDIWQFEVAVNSEEEGDFCFTLQLASKDGTKTGSKYKVTGRVQNGQMTSTVEELPETGGSAWMWIAIGGAAAVVTAGVMAALLVLRKKKAKR